MSEKLIVANASGFYGDRLSAPEDVIRGGPIDVLTGDYLAELTMAILARRRTKDPSAGYVPTFVRQLETILGECLDRSIRIVTNAGGLNPRGLAAELGELAGRLGLRPKIAYIEGDDLLGRLADLERMGEPLKHMEYGVPLNEAKRPVITANAYIGGWGIREALAAGADIVVCPRVADASLVVGPAAWKLGFGRQDWDKLAHAVVAGHILECGTQATGGNYAFFEEVLSFRSMGFPIAEIEEDGSFVITKHPGTGGLVSVGTVTAQLLYEIQGARYKTPDVTAHFDSIELFQEFRDRVRVSCIRGSPPPATSKVAISLMGGFRNSMTVVLSGLDIPKKAALVQETLFEALGGRDLYSSVEVELSHVNPVAGSPDEGPLAYLTISVTSHDPHLVGKRFSSEVIAMALASIPGMGTTTPPDEAKPFAIFWPALISNAHLKQTIKLGDTTIEVQERIASFERGEDSTPSPTTLPSADISRISEAEIAAGFGAEGGSGLPVEMTRVPLGRLFGARSGDKGGNANIGVWARTTAAFTFLRSYLSVVKLRELLPTTAGLEIERCELPNLLAINFVIKGLLGEGVGASLRIDPQGKALSEVLRSRMIELPAALLREE